MHHSCDTKWTNILYPILSNDVNKVHAFQRPTADLGGLGRRFLFDKRTSAVSFLSEERGVPGMQLVASCAARQPLPSSESVLDWAVSPWGLV